MVNVYETVEAYNNKRRIRVVKIRVYCDSYGANDVYRLLNTGSEHLLAAIVYKFIAEE